MDDLEFIKKFSKIKVKYICNKLKIDSSNLWKGKASKEKIKLVRKEIEKELKEIEG